MTKSLAVHTGSPIIEKEFPRWPVWDEKDIQEIEEVIRSGIWGVGGTRLPEFTRQFAEFQHVDFVLPVANGSIAIDLALEALGLGKDDEVIVPDYTFMATAVAPIRRGIKPVLVDVEAETFNIDPKLIEDAITDKTKAIIPVHFGGHPCDMPRIMEISERNELFVIEDCAHATGAILDNQYAGTFGSIGTFSFQSSKTLCCGEGGAVVTRSEDLFAILKSIHNADRRGSEDDYNHYICGTNYRMTELQAGLLLTQMSRLEGLCNKREQNGILLNKYLCEIEGVKPQGRHSLMERHGNYLYTFILEADIPRDDFTRALRAEGVPLEEGYPPLHKLDCLKNEGVVAGSFPVSDQIADRSVWISHHALLGDGKQIALIAEAIKKVIQFRDELKSS